MDAVGGDVVPMSFAARSDTGTTDTPELGVLLVHGIGDQRRGSTLVSFATPLVEWLNDRVDSVSGAVAVTDTLLDDESVPAHSELELSADGLTRRWILAETWWAMSFPAPRFSEMARWSLGVAPWTLGSHFGVAVRRVVRERPDSWAHAGWWALRVVSALLSLLGGLLLSLVILAVLVASLAVAVIPLRVVREAVARFQLRLASTLGDSYALVMRPIEAAAITGRLRRDLAWLELMGCQRVAIVAHSQGAAVACKALQPSQPEALVSLVTFGSGLRKLEGLEWLRHRATFRWSAVLALVGLIATGLGIVGLPVTLDLFDRGLASAGSVVTYAVLALAGLVLLVAGIRDFVVRGDVASLQRLAAWRRHFEQRQLSWLDLHASADPVPNGGLDEADASEGPASSVRSIEVTNVGSMVRDHNAYWRNRDEFVGRVGSELLRADGGLTELALSEDDLHRVARLRSWRVGLLRFARSVAIASVVALLVRFSTEWTAVAGYSGQEAMAWAGRLVGADVPSAAPLPGSTWWQTAGWAAAVVAAFQVTRWAWLQWDRSETTSRAVWPDIEWDTVTAVAVLVQAVVVGVAMVGPERAGWVIGSTAATMVVAWMLYLLRRPETVPRPRSEAPPPPEPAAVRIVSTAWRFFRPALVLSTTVIGLWVLATGTRSLLGRVFPDLDPSLLLSGLVLAIGVLLAGLLITSLVAGVTRIRNRSAARAGTGDPAGPDPERGPTGPVR